MSELNVTLTQEIYEKSRQPEVQALFKMADPTERAAKAQELIADGVILCKEIDIWGMDAAKMMFTWADLGLPWVPNAAQPGLVNPLNIGGGFSGTPTDMSKPWPNSIKVSVDANDYPPHDAVVAPPKEPLVGSPQYANGTWPVTSETLNRIGQGTLHVGQTIPQDGKKFKLGSIQGAWGPIFWYDEVTA